MLLFPKSNFIFEYLLNVIVVSNKYYVYVCHESSKKQNLASLVKLLLYGKNL